MPDAFRLTRQVTSRKEKPSCLRESAQFNGNRWGDYTRTEIDPADGMSFWHINQYAQSGDWHTRVGKFNFVGGGGMPTPTPTPTPAACSWAAGARPAECRDSLCWGHFSLLTGSFMSWAAVTLHKVRVHSSV